MESHKAGFPPFPHSVEIPSGLPHFPRPLRREEVFRSKSKDQPQFQTQAPTTARDLYRMFPVQSVTDVPVHSLLRKVWLPCFVRSAESRLGSCSRAGVGGRNRRDEKAGLRQCDKLPSKLPTRLRTGDKEVARSRTFPTQGRILPLAGLWTEATSHGELSAIDGSTVDRQGAG